MNNLISDIIYPFHFLIIASFFSGPSKNAIQKLIAGAKNLSRRNSETQSKQRPTKKLHNYSDYQLSVRSTNMMLLSLFIVTERKGFLNMNSKKVYKSRNCKYESVIFSLRANHHTVSWNGMTDDFVNQGYTKENGFNMHGVEVFFHEIVTEKEVGERDAKNLLSTYPVSYICAKQRTAVVPETFVHKEKFAVPLEKSYCEKRFYTKYEDTVMFIKHLIDKTFESAPYKTVADLLRLAKILGFEKFEASKEAPFFDVFQKIKALFQYHYRLGISIVDGQHRLCMCVKAYNNECLSMNFNSIKETNEGKAKAILSLSSNSFTSKLQACLVFAMYQFPKMASIRQKSLVLFRKQKLMFSRTLGNIIQECVERCDTLLKNKPMFMQLDVESLWYGHLYTMEKKTKKTLQTLENFEIAYEKYKNTQPTETNDPFLSRNQGLLPNIVPIMCTSDTLYDNKTFKVPVNDIKIYVFALSQYYRSFLTPSEVSKRKPGGTYKIPFNMRILLYILQVMLLTKKRRDTLFSFSLKHFSNIAWPWSTNFASSLDKSFHSIDFLFDLVKCHTEITKIVIDFLKKKGKEVDKIENFKNKFLHSKIEAMIKGVLMEQLFVDIMKINENPSFDQDTLKMQLSEKVYEAHFDGLEKKGLVRCCLSFYPVHVKFFLNTQFEYCKNNPRLSNTYGKNFLTRLETATQGMFKNLSKDVFSIKDFKIPEHTDDEIVSSRVAYNPDHGTIIPGSFFNFCIKIGINNASSIYSRFSFIDETDFEPDNDNSKSAKKKKSNVIEDQYASLLDNDVYEWFSSQKEQYSSNPLKLKSFVHECFEMIKTKAAHNKGLSHMLDFVKKEINESLPDKGLLLKDSENLLERMKNT